MTEREQLAREALAHVLPSMDGRWIERLATSLLVAESELAELRKALEKILALDYRGPTEQAIARAALGSYTTEAVERPLPSDPT